MQRNTMKDTIIKYVLLKIQSRTWDAYSKIPSAQSISNSFYCHVNTVKSAFSQLVSNQVLYSKNGKGYYVNPHSSLLFSSFRKKYKISDIRYKKLTAQERKILLKEFSEDELHKTIKKEYYLNNKLIAVIYSIMLHPMFNHYECYPVDKNTSFPVHLANSGIIVGAIERKIIPTSELSIRLPVFDEGSKLVVKRTNIYDYDYTLIEKSYSLIKTEYFHNSSMFIVR